MPRQKYTTDEERMNARRAYQQRYYEAKKDEILARNREYKKVYYQPTGRPRGRPREIDEFKREVLAISDNHQNSHGG